MDMKTAQQCNTVQNDTNHINRPKTLLSWPIPSRPRLDSCLISAPIDCLTALSPSATISNALINDQTGEVFAQKQNIRSSFLPYGVHSINIRAENILIEFSAKILREQYFNLISRNTIEHALHNLNETDGTTFDPRVILDAGCFFRCDTTTDLWISRYPPDYIAALQFSLIHPDYSMDTYGHNETIVFTKRTKTRKHRLSIYWKYPELLKDRDIQRYIDPDRYWPVIRVERNIRTFEEIRSAFGVKGCFISEVLNSPRNPNIDLFNSIKPIPPRLIEEYREDVKLKQIVKREGMTRILEQYGFDMGRVEKFIRRHVRGNISRYFRDYWELAEKIAANKNMWMANESMEEGSGDHPAELIEEIRGRLSAALLDYPSSA